MLYDDQHHCSDSTIAERLPGFFVQSFGHCSVRIRLQHVDLLPHDTPQGCHDYTIRVFWCLQAGDSCPTSIKSQRWQCSQNSIKDRATTPHSTVCAWALLNSWHCLRQSLSRLTCLNVFSKMHGHMNYFTHQHTCRPPVRLIDRHQMTD